jgi:tripartite-type tricarboxylate transporter receptor subunit TctC
MGTGSSLAQNPAMREGLGYDPLADLTPVGLVAQAVGVLAVAPEAPLNSLADVVDHARDQPEALAYGSSGVGMANHLAMELLMQRTGTRMRHVPLKSDAEIGSALSAGRVQLGFLTLTSALPLARSGRIRVLAQTHSGALAALPGVPSIGATGIAELNALEPFTFFGVVGPRGLAGSLARRLNAAINTCLVSPSMMERLDGVQLVPVPDDASGFAAHLLAQFAKWREIGRSASFHD